MIINDHYAPSTVTGYSFPCLLCRCNELKAFSGCQSCNFINFCITPENSSMEGLFHFIALFAKSVGIRVRRGDGVEQ